MKARKVFLYIDITIQTVLIASIFIAICIYLLGIEDDNGFAILGMVAALFIGIWQVLSGLILAVTTKDKWREQYLLSVAMWFASMVFLSYIDSIHSIAYIVQSIAYILLLAPFAFAIAYFRHTYLHLLKITSLPVSFWQLK